MVIGLVIRHVLHTRAIVGSIALHIFVVVWFLMNNNPLQIKPTETIKIKMVIIPPVEKKQIVTKQSVKPIKQAIAKPLQKIQKPSIPKPVVKKVIAKPQPKPVMVKQQKPQKPIIQQHAEPVKPVAVPLPVVPQAPAVTENAIMPAKAVMQPVPEAKIEENISQSTQQKAPETSAKQITVDTDNTTKETQKSAVSASYSNETTSSIITGPQFNAAYLNNPAPEYPASAKRRHMQGKVLLNVTVGTNGNALRVNLSKSSGFSLLDTLAKDTVMRWTFIPAKRGEQPMQANVIVPIEFRLE